MILDRIQQQAFNNIVKYGKAFIFWGRCTGKTHLLSHIIQTYVGNKKDEDIIFFVNQKNHIQTAKYRIIKDLHHSIRSPSKSGRKQKPEEVLLINNNYLTICSIKEYDYYLLHLKPTLIIYDDFLSTYLSNNFDCLINYIRKDLNCKVVFTSYDMDMRLVRLLDVNNDYYINIMPGKELIVSPNVMDELLLYKSDELIDYDDVVFQRRKKLKQLKILSNGNDI